MKRSNEENIDIITSPNKISKTNQFNQFKISDQNSLEGFLNEKDAQINSVSLAHSPTYSREAIDQLLNYFDLNPAITDFEISNFYRYQGESF